MAKAIPQLIDGEWRGSRSRELVEVTDPATQDVLALAPKATADEIEQAIASAQRAFETWREVPAPERARLMLRYQHLLKEHHDELGELLARETGKNLADAKGDVWRGIEVVEHAANVASLMMGETVENVAREIDTASWIQPLGVCAGITPFNFPAMIPLWMFPLAIACGNTFVLKPSEQDPLTPNRLAELFLEAGAPKGVLQVIHGGREQVDALLTHPDIRAISFVGSVAVGQHVYRTGWQDPDAAYGPLISPQARQRVLRLIAEGKAEGAECLLDGSQCQVEGYPNGNWLGPTLFRAVTPKMGLYREEIFGPVLACLEVDTLEEAIALVNANPYGNGTSLFTRSGGAARRYQHAVQVGQVGINVPIPVPLPFFSFTGWKGSFYGDLHAYGKQAVRFYTETKTVTSRWFDDEPTTDESSAGPNMTIHLK
ncbi:CoA-acylating methylmalonate-semialdehyde dehydrogenase [Pseudomonas aeruginosa]|uniref:CoA-acylating methylmalonate-semialdehyde dehydrogenase n=1 Tax=Pseudomonas aeruginosa TaxID=287 RepID=UPI0010472ED9|nr:CoA-acylating methylmalonate-semialdehyde dehydrogenase [Pseudomonas aeruginosa]